MATAGEAMGIPLDIHYFLFGNNHDFRNAICGVHVHVQVYMYMYSVHVHVTTFALQFSSPQ